MLRNKKLTERELLREQERKEERKKQEDRYKQFFRNSSNNFYVTLEKSQSRYEDFIESGGCSQENFSFDRFNSFTQAVFKMLPEMQLFLPPKKVPIVTSNMIFKVKKEAKTKFLLHYDSSYKQIKPHNATSFKQTRGQFGFSTAYINGTLEPFAVLSFYLHPSLKKTYYVSLNPEMSLYLDIGPGYYNDVFEFENEQEALLSLKKTIIGFYYKFIKQRFGKEFDYKREEFIENFEKDEMNRYLQLAMMYSS